MATKEGVTTTEALGQVIAEFTADQHDMALAMVAERTAYFRHCIEQVGPVEFVKAFYEAFDETIQPFAKSGTSCKRGCHFCCRQNVTISEAEALVIVEYCQEHGIDMPREYFLEQLKYGWKEVASTIVGWCAFLKNGECSIYPARPLACRKYYVASPPEQCDVITYPADKFNVGVMIYTIPEIEASAFWAVVDKKGSAGRLPEVLLPYSK